MGIRNWGFGIIATLVAVGLSSASAPGVAATPPVTTPEWMPAYNLSPALATEYVAATTGQAPDPLSSTWASCAMPLNISYAAGPGVNTDVIRRELAYPVRYLQELGYSASIGPETPYATNMPIPTTPGTVLVVATMDRAEQANLSYGTHRASAVRGMPVVGVTESGLVSVMASNGLASDVLLHELGHILGLTHKEGTVMAAGENSTLRFDPAETAAIDCRLSAGTSP